MFILLVEDDRDLATNLVEFLQARGHSVDYTGDGRRALHLARTHEYDGIILDLLLPGRDGVRVCHELRHDGYSMPILMLTARGELEDRVLGLEEGADDYIVKPVAMAELEARLRAMDRRSRSDYGHAVLRVADLVLNESTLEVMRDGTPIELPRVDREILRILMRDSPSVVARNRLERQIWGDEPPMSDALRSHIHQLRLAIDRPFERRLLHNVRGVGYRLAELNDETSP